jgi:aldose 1-epimerase
MPDDPYPFGTLADGRPVRAARLAWPGGIEAELIEYGATLRSLTVPARRGRVETVLGFATLAEYEADRMYVGVAVGRCANRIDNARFQIDGRTFHVTANEGPNCLHGGARGFSRRLWRLEEASDRVAVLAYDSPDGEEGFPGAVAARVRFALDGPDALTIAWQAETDRPTPVNLTHHLYFNLSGDRRRPVLDHALGVASDAITPVGPDLIPTGEIMPVVGTPFDLRAPRRIGEALAEPNPQLALGSGGFDHNWRLDPGGGPALTLRSPATGVEMAVTTDQPGVQIYTGQGLDAPFARHGGIAIEPQAWPDAVNRPSFPDVVLRPGATYRRSATYRFMTGSVEAEGA